MMPKTVGRSSSHACVINHPPLTGHPGLSGLSHPLLFNVYSRVVMQAPGNADMLDVHMHLGSVSYLGHHYELALPEVPGPLGLALLDNLSLYFCIMVTLLPRASMPREPA